MTQDHENTKGYYRNWPDDTKAEVDAMVAEGYAEDWPPSRIPEVDPLYASTFDDDLIPPDVPLGSSGTISPEWQELGAVIDGIDAVEAYNRWIGKGIITNRNQREINIRCPMPDHKDDDPSATLNLGKGEDGLWNCHKCNIGGDKFHLAAIRFGYGFDELRGPRFADLKREMAVDLGWHDTGLTSPSGEPQLMPPGTAVPMMEQLEHAPAAPAEPTPEERDNPPFEWEEIAGSEEHPLYEWMRQTSLTDLPDEFLFFVCLQMLALASGRTLHIRGDSNIYPTLYFLLIGPSSTGKSRCCRLMQNALEIALPFEEDEFNPMGVLNMGQPASGEAIITELSPPITEIDDNGTPRTTAQRVKALIDFDEFAELSKRARRTGDITSQILMRLADAPPRARSPRADRRNRTVAIEPFTCIVSTCQPAVLHKYIDESDVHSGFINRWLPVMTSQEKPPQVLDRHVPNLSLAFHAQLAERERWANDPHTEHVVKFTPEAGRLWTQFFVENIQPIKANKEDPLITMYGRIETHILKIMICLCVNQRTNMIDEDIVQRTILLWRHVYRAEQNTLKRIETNVNEDLRERIRIILRGQSIPLDAANLSRIGMRRRDVQQTLTQHRNRTLKLEDFNYALKTLEENGEIHQYETPTGGRKAKIIEWLGD